MKRNLPTISVILYKSKVLANGEHPIMLRVSYNGKRKYKSTGLSCSEKHWNEKKSEVRASHPQSVNMNKKIHLEQNKAYQYVMSLGDSDYSANSIIKAVSKSAPTHHTLFSLFEERMDFFYNVTKKYNTATGYKTLLNIIKRYRNSVDLELFEIDSSWLSDFELYLRTHYKDNSIRKFFDCFRAIFNYAISKNYLKSSPFENFVFSKKLDCNTRKRALDERELLTLIDYYREHYGLFGEKHYKAPEKTKVHYWNERFKPKGTNKLTVIDAEQFSLALFLLSYFFQGLALVDIANLKRKHIIRKRMLDKEKFEYDLLHHGLDYANQNSEEIDVYDINALRAKTNAQIRIVVEQTHVIPYLKPFGFLDKDGEPNDYVVPIFENGDESESTKFCRMKYVIYLVNKNLKSIAARLGISEDITFYSARHTYASVLYHSKVPMGLIAQNLARSVEGIQTYLKNFDEQSIYYANKQATPYDRRDIEAKRMEMQKRQNEARDNNGDD